MAALTLQLLDEVVAHDDGQPIDLGGPRQRALLVRLALERGRALSLDALIDDLWDAASPRIRTALRAYMSRLRATAFGPWLHGGRDGYRLAEAPGLTVDLWLLDDAVSRATTADVEASRDLLRLWRDTPLQGIGEPPFAERARLSMRRSVDAARLRGARMDLDAGRVDRALTALHPLLVAHPEDDDVLAMIRVAEARAAASDRVFARVAAAGAGARHSASAGTVARPGAAPPSIRPSATPRGSASRRESAAIVRRRGVPAPIAGIVGRREERAALTAALDVSRLVTLTGAAGVGKTRLVVDWLGGDAVAGEEHIWFVDLSGVDGDRAGEVIAASVGAAGATTEGIAEHLADRRGILVLDGTEAAGPAVATIAGAVLSTARGLAVLSTSRRPLDIPGESVLRIGPLPLDDAKALYSARAVRGTAKAGDDEVAQLIETLGSLPLAIELAAARASAMPLADVAGSLLRDLNDPDGHGDAPLAAALRSSLDLLSPEQRDTLREVSGFAAPFTREAVAAVCAGRSRDSDLDRLVAFSLISAEDGGAGPAFRVSELVRRAALGTDVPGEEWSRHHRLWIADCADRASAALTVDGSAAVIDRIRSEWPDVVAAFGSAVRANDRASAAAIAGGLLWFAVRSGRQRELLELSRRACGLPGATDAAHEAQLALTRGFLAYQLGSMREAATWIAAAAEPAERSGDPSLRGAARAFAAYLLTLDPRARADPGPEIAAALVHLEHMPEPAAAMVLLIAGQVQRAAGHAAEALALVDRAGARAARCGHEWVVLMAPVVAAKVHLDLRQGRPALAALHPVVRRSSETGDPVSLLIAASVAAGAAAALGDDATGARIVGAVDAIGRRYGFDPRANEPADFELYLRRVREGLTATEWRGAYALGLACEVDELVELTASLGAGRG